MINEGLDLDVTKLPTRNVVAKWCINSMKEIPNSIVNNCWLLTGYFYSPNETKHATPAMETETNGEVMVEGDELALSDGEEGDAVGI